MVTAWTPPALVELQLRLRPHHRCCYYCDAELALTADDVAITPWGDIIVRPGLQLPTTDHKIPVSRGGTDDISNLALACRSCNSSKCARTPDEFAPVIRARIQAELGAAA